MTLKMEHLLSQTQLESLAPAVEALNQQINELCDMPCDIVLSVRRNIGGRRGTFVLSRLHPEEACQVLWYALGDLQVLLKATKAGQMQPPPSDTIN